jgi:hypothetical protein
LEVLVALSCEYPVVVWLSLFFFGNTRELSQTLDGDCLGLSACVQSKIEKAFASHSILPGHSASLRWRVDAISFTAETQRTLSLLDPDFTEYTFEVATEDSLNLSVCVFSANQSLSQVKHSFRVV